MAHHYGIHEPADDDYYYCARPDCACHSGPDAYNSVTDFLDSTGDDEPAAREFYPALVRFLDHVRKRNRSAGK